MMRDWRMVRRVVELSVVGFERKLEGGCVIEYWMIRRGRVLRCHVVDGFFVHGYVDDDGVVIVVVCT